MGFPSVGFTYGYPRCPASRDGDGAGSEPLMISLAVYRADPDVSRAIW